MKFRKKPAVIDGVQWLGLNIDEIVEFAGDALCQGNGEYKLGINTLDSTAFAEVGDWIVKGVKGEFYPCKPDIFADTYEPVENARP